MAQNLVQRKQITDLPVPFNYINNGSMAIWQRGTSFPGIDAPPGLVASPVTADRFRVNIGDAFSLVEMTATQEVDVPSSSNSLYSLKVENTTAEAVDAGDRSTISYTVEGYDYRGLYGNNVTLSFSVKSNLTGTYCFAMYNSGPFAPDRAYVSEYTINAANTWETKEITVDIDYVGGINNFENGRGLKLSWTLSAGTSFQATSDTWHSDGDPGWPAAWPLATANQVNLQATIGNYFQLADAQLELGERATPFMYLPVQDELAWCQRYFEKSYNLTTVPGTVTVDGVHHGTDSTLSPSYQCNVRFNTRKRISPTVAVYSPTSGTIAMILQVHPGAATDIPVSTIVAGETAISYITTPGLGIDPLFLFALHYTADADL